MKLAIVFGTRPELLKLIPIIRALENHRPGTVALLDTQQQRELTSTLLNDYDLGQIPVIRFDAQRSTMSKQLGSQLLQLDDLVNGCAGIVVQGDTISSVAGALVGFYRELPVVHIEAGLRSHDKSQPYPEEMNRRLVSEIAGLHLAPTQKAKQHLLDSGIKGDTISVVGNPLADLCREVDINGGNHWDVLITLHRRENRASGIRELCMALPQLLSQYPRYRFAIVQHTHPEVHRRFMCYLPQHANLDYAPPMTHHAFLNALCASKLVITDSGGVQEEAAMFGIATLVMRGVLDREDGIAEGTARLVDANCDEIVSGANYILQNHDPLKPLRSIPYEGCSELIAAHILAYYALDQESVA